MGAKATHLVIAGLRPWTGVFIPPWGIISNGNFTDAQIKKLEASGHTFVESDVPAPVGLDLTGQGVLMQQAPPMLSESWEGEQVSQTEFPAPSTVVDPPTTAHAKKG
jgi:hypothetical protein